MGAILLIVGIVAIGDAFGSEHFRNRQHWEIGVGILLLIIGGILYAFTGDDD